MRPAALSITLSNMPLGYLFGATIAALATMISLAPVRRLPNLSFRVGLLVGELPHVLFCWLVASTLLAAAQDDLATPVGLAALAVIVLTVPGLVMLVRRGLRARPGLEEALGVALPARRSAARLLLAPFPFRPRGVERIADIAYGPAGKRNRLDVLRPRSGQPTGPTLVYFHGGGFYSGAKNREARPLLHRLAAQGWVCVSADYRLRPSGAASADVTYDDHLGDARAVLDWVREHGPEYGADPGAVFVAGSSAGAHLAARCALDPGTGVAGAICLYGWYGDVYGEPSTAPADHVHPDAPPFLIVHGDKDSLVPVEGPRAFAATLGATSRNPVVYAELPGAQHTFDYFHSIRFTAVIDAVEAFAAGVTEQVSSLKG